MTYEYACEACSHQWEAEQSIKDAPLKTCVACGKNAAKRLISGGTGFLLKGGGWYADGYGSKPASSSASGEAPAAKATSEGGGSGGNSDTKSEGSAKSPAPSEGTPSKPAEASPKASSAPSTAKAS